MGGFQSIGTIPGVADDRIPDESTDPKANDNEEHKVNIGDESTDSPSDRGPSLVQTAGSPNPGPNLPPLNLPDGTLIYTGMSTGSSGREEPIRIPLGGWNGSGDDDSPRNQTRATGGLENTASPSQSGSLLESTQTPPRRAAGGLADPLSPDPALAPAQTVEIPPIPDKVWEEAGQRRAAEAEEAPKIDWWQAQKMADTLSQTTDYDGAEQHYRRQADSDPIGTRAEIDAVAQSMGQTDPQAAQRFLDRMDAAGLRGTDSLSRGRSYTESGLLGSWRSNVENQTGQTLTPAADTRTSASSEDQSSPPANKADYFKRRNPPGTWDDFRDRVQGLPDTGRSGKFALVELFGQEGGVPKDSASTASSGILQKTLDNAKHAGVPGLESATTPSNLTNEQRAAVMRYKLDSEELSHVGGIKALDRIGDDQAAAALADTLYRHGGVDGPRLLQQAINIASPGSVPETGYMGNQTLEAYGRLASSPASKGKLLDALADKRATAVPFEKARFDYYRYLGRR